MRPRNLPGIRPARAGFTLAELLVVLIVVMIAAAVVIPRAVGMSGMRSQAAARIVMADLEYAQNHAIVTQQPVTVTFDLTGNSYTVSNASGTLNHPITKKAYVVDFDTTSGFDDVSITSANFGGGSTVTFDALGAPDKDGTVRIAAGADVYEVTVAPVTGRVTVAKVP